MSERGSAPGVWTPANIVTCVRIALIPVFMVVAIDARGEAGARGFGTGDPVLSVAAFALYLALSLTDKVDGYLARSRGEVTDFGKFLDPIADKLLVFSALLLLLEQGSVSVWVVFVILLREFLVSALRMVAGAQGEVIAADALGKAKTAVTMVSLCSYYLAAAALALGLAQAGEALALVSWALMVAAVVLTVVSGAQYFWSARHVVFGR
ncbi:CDP-diacylglycerol--glycerol-3-phosphate 3-phosphatidyltransferase [Thermophilibacter sp.]